MKLLEGRPGSNTNATSLELLDFTLAKFIRIRFQGMHTTTNSANNIQWMVDNKELNKRSFYTLRYIKIGARLDCNGHAQRAKQYNNDEVSSSDFAQQFTVTDLIIIIFFFFGNDAHFSDNWMWLCT